MAESDAHINECREETLLAAREALTGIAELLANTRNNATKIAELSFRLNEQVISFSEKFVLLDGGTIALSLSL
jgi:hypothetical protein